MARTSVPPFAVLISLGGRFCNKTLIGHEDWVRSVIATADGKTLASCSNDQTIRLWDVGSGKCAAVLRGHTHVVETICYATEAAQTAMTAHGLRVCPPLTAATAVLKAVAGCECGEQH